MLRASAAPSLFPTYGSPALDDLASGVTAAAYRAHCRLVRPGGAAFDFLSGPLRPARLAPAERVAHFLAEIGAERYAVRSRAMRELEDLGESAGPWLQKALESKPTLEVSRRVERLLAKQAEPRPRRAIDVLECIGNRPARELLARLAAGSPEARLTQDAPPCAVVRAG